MQVNIAQKVAKKMPERGLLVVFFDAPDNAEMRHWLFDSHAQDVLRTLPGASRSRTFQVLNPAEPGQPRWLTLIKSEDIIATWQHRCFSADTGARDAATARGVSNRREYYVRTVNDVGK